MPTSVNPNLMYLVSFALWGVWLQRHHRWGYFWAALTGQATIIGTRPGASPTSALPIPSAWDILPGGQLGTGGGSTPELPGGQVELPQGPIEVPLVP
jgi:hypothetical protein